MPLLVLWARPSCVVSVVVSSSSTGTSTHHGIHPLHAMPSISTTAEPFYTNHSHLHKHYVHGENGHGTGITATTGEVHNHHRILFRSSRQSASPDDQPEAMVHHRTLPPETIKASTPSNDTNVDASSSSTTSPTSTTTIFTWNTVLTLILPYTIIFLLSIVGNVLVIITLTLNRSMRSVTNIFLLNLAVSDLLLGVFCMPFTLVGVLLKNFVFGPVMCHLISYLQCKRKWKADAYGEQINSFLFLLCMHPKTMQPFPWPFPFGHWWPCRWNGTTPFAIPFGRGSVVKRCSTPTA